MSFYNVFHQSPYFVASIGMLLSFIVLSFAASREGGVDHGVFERCLVSTYKLFGIIFLAPVLLVDLASRIGLNIHLDDRIICALLALSVCLAANRANKAVIDGTFLYVVKSRSHEKQIETDEKLLSSYLAQKELMPYRIFLSVTNLYYGVLFVCAVWEIIDPVIK